MLRFRSPAVGREAASVGSHHTHTYTHLCERLPSRWIHTLMPNGDLDGSKITPAPVSPLDSCLALTLAPPPAPKALCASQHHILLQCVCSAVMHWRKDRVIPQIAKNGTPKMHKMTNYAYRACINTAVTLSNASIMDLFIFRVQFHPHSEQPNCAQVEISLETRWIRDRRAHADAS